ncbi:hypothetical protein DPMN_050991 [Dreissena polymorpha]|uniref:Uncharacterized protein n=1 Tax=Dreissena polymorpha TaxID=45954 RepID=A0A9D4HPU1_DREPO|nr:hypothetical protein DPMN_050991 [Dreissena polymorpha]
MEQPSNLNLDSANVCLKSNASSKNIHSLCAKCGIEAGNFQMIHPSEATCFCVHVFKDSTNKTVVHGDDPSRNLFKMLDYVGYSHDMVSERRRVFHEKDSIINSARDDEIVSVTTGSKAEGFASCYDSDHDRLNVYRNIVCRF